MQRFALFVLSCLMAGLGAVLGSIAGHKAGPRGVMIGAVFGGFCGAVASAFVARQLRWIQPGQLRGTALGASGGFFLAAAIASHTLRSPLGPLLSTSLVGVGALLGSWRRRPSVTGVDATRA